MPPGVVPPEAPRFPPDAVTEAVATLVERELGDHFGDIAPFSLPVTAEQAAAFGCQPSSAFSGLEWMRARLSPR